MAGRLHGGVAKAKYSEKYASKGAPWEQTPPSDHRAQRSLRAAPWVGEPFFLPNTDLRFGRRVHAPGLAAADPIPGPGLGMGLQAEANQSLRAR